MNTRKQAEEKIAFFLRSDRRFLQLTGTHQNRKHLLALELVLSHYPSPATVLFRANHVRNIESFLSPLMKLPKSPRPGTQFNIQGGYMLYFDTINPASWRSSPKGIDAAILYPLDSLNPDEGDDCVQDLVRRNTKKVFLVSWTDNRDFSWTNQFDPVQVIYDAEEEDPDYHKRMMELLSSTEPERIFQKKPDYAESTQDIYLVKILCRGRCNSTRWAKLNKPYPGKSALRAAQMGEYRATCLSCGYVASDNYNWFR
jgi:hypothetical protein